MTAVANALISHTGFSTVGMRASEAEELCNVRLVDATMRPLPGRAEGPVAVRTEAALWHLGHLLWGTGSMSPQSHTRLRQHLRRDHLDLYRLTVLSTGRELRFDHEGQRGIVPVGTAFITDMAREETLFWPEDVTLHMLWLPRTMLDRAIGRALPLHGAVVQGVAGALLFDFLQGLHARLGTVRNQELPGLSHAIVHMVAAGLFPSAETLSQTTSVVERLTRDRALRHVELHLADPGLSPETLCKAIGVSRSVLYRLFEPMGGVARHVKLRRLQSVHEELASGRGPVGRVAAAYGFDNPSHFSREFRREYGHAPSETLERAPHPDVVSMASGGERMGRWLGQLQHP